MIDVAEVQGAIMILDMMTELGLTVNPATGEIYHIEGEREHEIMLQAIHNYQSRIILREGAVPIRHGRRRLPLSYVRKCLRNCEEWKMLTLLNALWFLVGKMERYGYVWT